MSEQQTAPTEDNPASSVPTGQAQARRPWGTLAMVLCTALGVAGALWWHDHRQPDAPIRSPVGRVAPERPAPAEETLDFLEPDKGLGLYEVSELPEDLPMPAQAERLTLVELRRPGLSQIKAEYQTAGAADNVQAWMIEQLSSRGWVPAGQADTPGAPTLFFHNWPDSLSLRLHSEGEIVKIEAVVTRAMDAE